MQKDVAIGIVMTCLLLGFIGPVVDAKLTAQDVAWYEAIGPSIKALDDDREVVAAAMSTGDPGVVKKACDVAVEDVISAEVVNDAYTVSPAMQPCKDDFTTALTYMWSGFGDTSRSCSTLNITLIDQGLNELKMATLYITMLRRDLNVAITT